MTTHRSGMPVGIALVCVLACGGSEKPVDQPAASAQADCSACETRVSSLEARVAPVDALAERRKALADELESRLAELIGAHKVSVVSRRGLLVIQLPSETLFELGKATVIPDGIATLGQIAAALKQVEDQRFLVVGHTDNVPVARKTKAYKSNWELSALRGVSVVETLVVAGVSANRLGAAGFSESDPIAGNESADDRATNRRIEIVVLPDLEPLFKAAE